MVEMAGTDASATIERKLAEARLAEHTERYEDMAELMKSVVESSTTDLESTTRNLLSVAYKNVVGTKRSAWRLLSSLESKEAKDEQKKLIKEYKKKIEKDLRDVCDQVLVRCYCFTFILTVSLLVGSFHFVYLKLLPNH